MFRQTPYRLHGNAVKSYLAYECFHNRREGNTLNITYNYNNGSIWGGSFGRAFGTSFGWGLGNVLSNMLGGFMPQLSMPQMNYSWMNNGGWNSWWNGAGNRQTPAATEGEQGDVAFSANNKDAKTIAKFGKEVGKLEKKENLIKAMQLYDRLIAWTPIDEVNNDEDKTAVQNLINRLKIKYPSLDDGRNNLKQDADPTDNPANKPTEPTDPADNPANKPTEPTDPADNPTNKPTEPTDPAAPANNPANKPTEPAKEEEIDLSKIKLEDLGKLDFGKLTPQQAAEIIKNLGFKDSITLKNGKKVYALNEHFANYNVLRLFEKSGLPIAMGQNLSKDVTDSYIAGVISNVKNSDGVSYMIDCKGYGAQGNVYEITQLKKDPNLFMCGLKENRSKAKIKNADQDDKYAIYKYEAGKPCLQRNKKRFVTTR